MKTFLTTVKGKIVAGVSTAAVVGGIIAAVFVLNSGYRTIAVEALNGITHIVNGEKADEAYVGLHLKSGDDVTVSLDSDLTLALDTDMYVYAPENTHFSIEASGKPEDSRTHIMLDKGSNLIRIDRKLSDSENFDVDTPNATMSVRGTVYKVSVYDETNGDRYTVVDVFEGQVYVQVRFENGGYTGENRILSAGDEAIIRSNKDFSEFVKPEDFEKIVNIEDETHDGIKAFLTGRGKFEIGTINYSAISKEEAYFLGKIIDAGRELCIAKDLLFDYVDIIEHKYVPSEDDPEVLICVICGEEIDGIEPISPDAEDIDDDRETADDLTPTPAPTAVPEAENSSEDAGDSNSKRDVVKKGNVKSEEEQLQELLTLLTMLPTPTPTPVPNWDSSSEDSGSSKEPEYIPTPTPNPDPCAAGHAYAFVSTTATCIQPGEDTERCSNCGLTRTVPRRETGHSWGGWTQAADPTIGYGHEGICQNPGCSATSTIQACVPGTEYIQSQTEHCRKCTICGNQAEDYVSHTTRTQGETCSICGYVIPVS